MLTSSPVFAAEARAEPPDESGALQRAMTSREWRLTRVLVLPVIGAAAAVGSFYGVTMPFSFACSSGPCGLAMLGVLLSAYVMFVPAAIAGVGALMHGRGQYGLAVLGALAGVAISAVTALFGFPFFGLPMLVSLVTAPLGALLAYELSSFTQEANVIDRHAVVAEPVLVPVRDGFIAGVRIAAW
jgi:hypothetical protein